MNKLTKNYQLESFNLISYTDIDTDTHKALLKMRNSDAVRQMMVNKEPISFDSHLKFVISLKNSVTKGYWLIEKNNKIIGSLNIEDKGDYKYSGGLFVNPEYMNQGYGLLINYILMEQVFTNFNGLYFSSPIVKENSAAIRLHKFLKGNIEELDDRYCEVNYTKEDWCKNRDSVRNRIKIF